MIALAVAVTPIMRLLVAVAIRSGTPIGEVHHGHLDDAAAHAEERGHDAGEERADDAAAEIAYLVAGTRQRSRVAAESDAPTRLGVAAPGGGRGSAGAGGRRGAGTSAAGALPGASRRRAIVNAVYTSSTANSPARTRSDSGTR